MYKLTDYFLQRKAENFYSKANVKNKNRQKAAVMKTLQKSGPGRTSRKKA